MTVPDRCSACSSPRAVGLAIDGDRLSDVASVGASPLESASVVVESVSVGYPGLARAVDDLSLEVEAGSIVALLGPSGCGKTTLLRAIAGLQRPSSGTVSIGDRVVSAARIWVKPERRAIGMMFQDGALFPHLSVADNIAFGLGSSRARHGRAARRARVDELLELVDLVGLGDRLPDTLSGGQQQRVALARSLAPNPSVLLLDEPFSALDAGLRVQVRADVARILRDVGLTSIFVTHDQDEAFVLGDRVAVMRQGRIEQVASPDELYRSPVNPWVAGFVGEANLVPGRRIGRHVDTSIGAIRLADQAALPETDEVLVLIRPEQVTLTDGADARITGVEYYGHDVRYGVLVDDGTILSARSKPGRLRRRGDRVSVSFDLADGTAVFPSDSLAEVVPNSPTSPPAKS